MKTEHGDHERQLQIQNLVRVPRGPLTTYNSENGPQKEKRVFEHTWTHLAVGPIPKGPQNRSPGEKKPPGPPAVNPPVGLDHSCPTSRLIVERDPTLPCKPGLECTNSLKSILIGLTQRESVCLCLKLRTQTISEYSESKSFGLNCHKISESFNVFQKDYKIHRFIASDSVWKLLAVWLVLRGCSKRGFTGIISLLFFWVFLAIGYRRICFPFSPGSTVSQYLFHGHCVANVSRHQLRKKGFSEHISKSDWNIFRGKSVLG